jgi:hypothetical protein
MPESDFIFEEGEAITVGSHGETSYVFAAGTPVPNGGVSTFVFESGTGLGSAGDWTFDGVPITAYETADTHTEFFGRESGPSPQAQGLLNQGIPTGGDKSYFLLHRSTATDTYCFIMWTYMADTGSGSLRIDYSGLQNGIPAGEADSPTIQDDPEFNQDFYDSSGGVPYTDHGWSGFNGDGVGYLLTGDSVEVDMTMSPGYQSDGRPFPDSWEGRGPDGEQVTRAVSDGSTITVSLL